MAPTSIYHVAHVPLPAKVCMNFFQRSAAIKNNMQFNKANSSKTHVKEQRDEKTTRVSVDMPVLLGRKHRLPHADTNHDADKTPATTARELSSDRSSNHSNSSKWEDQFSARSKNSPAFTVKNTFVHVDVGSDLDSPPAMRRCASAPLIFKQHASPMPQRSLTSPAIMEQARRSADSVIEPLASTEEISASKSQPEEISASAEISIGSQLHGAGNCKPCAWFWRAGGCENGTQCRHCHLCPEGEIKRRRKTRFVVARQRRHALLGGVRAPGVSSGSSGEEDAGH